MDNINSIGINILLLKGFFRILFKWIFGLLVKEIVCPQSCPVFSSDNGLGNDLLQFLQKLSTNSSLQTEHFIVYGFKVSCLISF